MAAFGDFTVATSGTVPQQEERAVGRRRKSAVSRAQHDYMQRIIHADRPRTCPTGKSHFADEVDAQRFTAAWGATRSVAERLYPYDCPYCHGWHVTKQDPSTKKRPRIY